MKRSTIWWWLHNVVAHGMLMGFLGEDHPWSLKFHAYSAGMAETAELAGR